MVLYHIGNKKLYLICIYILYISLQQGEKIQPVETGKLLEAQDYDIEVI